MDLGSSRPLNTILSMLLANVAPSLKIFSTFVFFCFFVMGGGVTSRTPHVEARISFTEFTAYFKTLVREKFTPQLSLRSSRS